MRRRCIRALIFLLACILCITGCKGKKSSSDDASAKSDDDDSGKKKNNGRSKTQPVDTLESNGDTTSTRDLGTIDFVAIGGS